MSSEESKKLDDDDDDQTLVTFKDLVGTNYVFSVISIYEVLNHNHKIKHLFF